MNPESVLTDIIAHFHTQGGRSLREFARKTGVRQSILSRVLKGNLRLSMLQAHRILSSLPLPVDLDSRFRASYALDRVGKGKSSSRNLVPPKRNSKAKPFLRATTRGTVIGWVDLAVIDYISISGNSQDIRKMSNRLSLNMDTILAAIERLEGLGLIVLKGHRYVKTRRKILFEGDVEKSSVRNIHRGLGMRALEIFADESRQARNRRYVTSYTLSVDPARIPLARTMIDEFQEKLIRFLHSEAPGSAVYGWSQFLVPLTSEDQDLRSR